MIYTAGGETSGIELALHIDEVAVKTARYMEYREPDWQTNAYRDRHSRQDKRDYLEKVSV